ncbi:hypothetical protein MPSEU_001052800 [Mayamaea pseudoterrestris]|nr:hypothetical protein MPSEU_001052800 [Mayamaea pseudoterrestris]
MHGLKQPCYLALVLLTAIQKGYSRPRIGSWLPWRKKSRSNDRPSSLPLDENKLTLLLDVDNTLYDESACEIESQIIRGIHDYCRDHLNMTPVQAQELHVKHGSTIQGLMNTRQVNKKLVQQFYKEVYQNVSVDSLLQTKGSALGTGYSHSSGNAENELVRDLLRSLAPDASLQIASNSPKYHVEKVIQALGLTRVPFTKIMTPDRRPNLFPTKAKPTVFFDKLLQQHHSRERLHLLDDSVANLASAKDYMNIYQVHGTGDSLLVALCRTLGYVPTNYTFDQVDYLRAKNHVDLTSLNRGTYQRMVREIVAASSSSDRVVIADLGAGLLSMLQLLLNGHGDDLPSLLGALPSNSTTIHYYAYEPNRALEQPCMSILQDMGFVWSDTINDDEHVYVRPSNGNLPRVIVHLRCWDFQQDAKRSKQPTPALVVGCCFADLIDPEQLTRSLLRQFSSRGDGTEHMLVYLPITFQGTTQFLPSKPFQVEHSTAKPVPSDTCAFACYAKALESRHAHHLDPSRLIDAMANHGGTLLQKGASDWIIDPFQNANLWNAMMYFFGTVACPELSCARWNAQAWIDRARIHQPAIYVSNVDLLFTLPPIGSWNFAATQQSTQMTSFSPTYSQLEFIAPNTVRVVDRKAPGLAPNQVRIKTIYSLISSGTELKVFTGNFDEAALDVNIKGMDTERMAYPLTYGYCLVGTVVECGSAVQDDISLVGKLVFAFAPHASQVVAERDAIQVVPHGIDPGDAIFMPSVETALSLVHDANPRVGERVIVFGQGLIGLLVTAILARSFPITACISSAALGALTTVDTLPARLAASAMMGAHEVLQPENVLRAQQFDVAIEISGNGKALQSAIDSTRNGGKIVIGSWYGNADVALKLGLDFHRSKKTLTVSQVSRFAICI